MRDDGRALLIMSLAAGLAACASGEREPSGQALDGRTYAVSLVSGAGSATNDDLVFKDGVFESSVCTKAGFEKSAYTTRLIAGGVQFTAECDSPEYGHNEWHGVAQGDQISGYVVRTPKNGGAPIRSTFEGSAR